MNDEPAILTTREVAEKFQVTERTVRRWVTQGLLLPFRTPGGHYRYRAEEVMESWQSSYSKQT